MTEKPEFCPECGDAFEECTGILTCMGCGEEYDLCGNCGASCLEVMPPTPCNRFDKGIPCPVDGAFIVKVKHSHICPKCQREWHKGSPVGHSASLPVEDFRRIQEVTLGR